VSSNGVGLVCTLFAPPIRRRDAYDPLVDVDEHVSAVEAECRSLSDGVEPPEVRIDPDGKRATIKVRVPVAEDVFLASYEVLDLSEGVARPRKYGHAIIERRTRGLSYDLDPTHKPEAHVHRGQRREPAPVVTRRDVVKEWRASGPSEANVRQRQRERARQPRDHD
jgi:hypothetical protein